MAPPSPLAIATSSVNRLLKEESSYRTELESQQKRLHSLEAQTGEDEDGNRGFQILQEVSFSLLFHFENSAEMETFILTRTTGNQEKAIRETEAVFGPLRESIRTAVEALESLLVCISSLGAICDWRGGKRADLWVSIGGGERRW